MLESTRLVLDKPKKMDAIGILQTIGICIPTWLNLMNELQTPRGHNFELKVVIGQKEGQLHLADIRT